MVDDRLGEFRPTRKPLRTMPSERRLAANRNNAKRSTGPRTARGKSRASRNALRHGLATVAQRNATALAQIERMAKAICGDGATRSQYEKALHIAESEHMIFMVRAARIAAIKRITMAAPQQQETYSGQPKGEEDAAQTAPEQQSAPEIYDEVAAFQHALPEMTKYDRYERRALSRRLRAIRTFVAAAILGDSSSPLPSNRARSKAPRSKISSANK